MTKCLYRPYLNIFKFLVNVVERKIKIPQKTEIHLFILFY